MSLVSLSPHRGDEGRLCPTISRDLSKAAAEPLQQLPCPSSSNHKRGTPLPLPWNPDLSRIPWETTRHNLNPRMLKNPVAVLSNGALHPHFRMPLSDGSSFLLIGKA